RLALHALARLGVDAACTGLAPDDAQSLARANLRPICQVAGLTSEHVLGLIEPSSRQQEHERLRARSEALHAEGVSTYSLGVGNCLAAAGPAPSLAPEALAGFRTWLQQEYRTIEALNASWKTRFTTWEEAIALGEKAAAAAGTPAPWVDLERYLESVFAGAHAAARDAIQEAAPGARVGFVARTGSAAYLGYDWQRLAAQLGLVVLPAGSLSVEKARSYRAADCRLGLAPGHDTGPPGPERWRWYLWYALLHGLQDVWWPDALATSEWVPFTAVLDAFGGGAPAFGELVRELDAVRGGLDELLLGAERVNCGIAVYDSRSSLYLNRVERPCGTQTPAAEAAFTALLEDLGYQYDFVSAAGVVEGALDAYSVLILPAARALGDSEVAAIRRFHAAGGHLIADLAPGVADAHGARRSQAPLHDLFGACVVQAESAAPVDALVQLRLHDGPVAGESHGAVADSSVDADGAAVGGMAGLSPVWLIHRDGDALSLLLNHAVKGGYRPRAFDEDTGGLRTLLAAVLRECGVKPAAAIETMDGAVFQGECVAYRLGDAELVALLPDRAAAPQQLALAFANPFVYDLRPDAHPARACFASGAGRIERRLDGVAVYAALPYEVTGLELVAPATVFPGDRLTVGATVRTKRGTPGTHLVRVALVPQEGPGAKCPIPYYTTTVICEGGLGSAYIPLALNELGRKYRLEARDVLTGVEASAPVRVQWRTGP
ncbi:MAG: beta-galactosidase trimerization domain-containing protein, partial [Candidatus Hydrogenedentes bacterium]|nr:beta-galactosidase trimerization domain-containing protein [Candidatus Hydrogenedentota bacterium]